MASYFTDALLVNPFDPDEIAEAMHAALTMSIEERKFRYTRLFDRLKELSADAFCKLFLRALSGTTPARAAA